MNRQSTNRPIRTVGGAAARVFASARSLGAAAPLGGTMSPRRAALVVAAALVVSSVLSIAVPVPRALPAGAGAAAIALVNTPVPRALPAGPRAASAEGQGAAGAPGSTPRPPAAETAFVGTGAETTSRRLFGTEGSETFRLCQALGPAAPCPVCAVDCSNCPGGGWRHGWECARARQWQAFAQGEYVGHPRAPHVPEYRLRVDDLLDLVYRRTREKTAEPYRLNVGDEIRVESFTDAELNRDLIIQPDGTITLRLLGQVPATDQTVPQLRDRLEELYKKYYKVPAITVTPLVVNSKLNDLVYSVDARYGQGGLARNARVTPEGTIALPVLGSVYVQGLTLDELQQELNERYREHVEGIQVIPVLIQRAPRYVYVLGEVANPGRYELTGPTTVMQAISMAGSWNVGAHLRHVVVFRRGDDWRLMAAMVDVSAALQGNQPCPSGEIWLNDSDVVLVPKSPLLRADDFIDMVFTRGIYGVFPMSTTLNFSKLSSL